MKRIKWKILFITSVVCLLPILIGLSLWEKLPDMVATHFNFNGEPDDFSTKKFAVFGIPLIMLAFQWFACIVCDISQKYSESNKLEIVVKWIIPAITIVLYIATLGYSIGWNLDMRKVVALIVGGIFVVTGSFLPEYDKVRNFKVDKEKARKINRFMGRGMVVLGILFLISIFLPPIATTVCPLLLIPYAIITFVYAIAVSRREVKE